MSESLKLIRHSLASINLEGFEDEKPMNEQERKDYVSAITAVYPRLEKDIRRFLYLQLLVMSKESENWEQVLFGRGVFDGMAQLLEHWTRIRQEHTDVNKTEGEFEKNSPIGEV